MEPIRTTAVVTMVQEDDGHTNTVTGLIRLEGECVVGMEGAEEGYVDQIYVYWKAPRSVPARIGQSVSIEMDLKPITVGSVIETRPSALH